MRQGMDTAALKLERRKSVAPAVVSNCAHGRLCGAAALFRLRRADGRIAFASRLNLFVLIWIVLGVGLVSRGRRLSPMTYRWP